MTSTSGRDVLRTLVTLGAVVVVVGSVATSGATAAVEVDIAPEDVEVGDANQTLSLRLGNLEPGEPVDVYVNVTSLEMANVGLDGAGVAVAGTAGASVSDAAVVDENGTVTVRLSVVPDEDSEQAAVELRVTGLDTGDAEPATDLRHYAAVDDERRVGENAPDADDRQSRPYDVDSPAEGETGSELHTMVAAHDVETGADEQALTVRVAEAAGEFVLGVDVTPLTGAGVAVDSATVAVDETHRMNVTDATLADGTVELRVVPDDETGMVRVRIDGLDTGDATPTSGLAYPVSVDGEPADPDESTSFDVVDPSQRTDEQPGTRTVTPMPSPTPDESTPGSDGTAGDGSTGADGPGFGPAGAVGAVVAAALAAFLARRRRA